MRFEDLTGRTVVIWGAGREGRAAHAELARRGLAPMLAVTDDDSVADDLRGIAACGAAARERLESADVVIKSPGIPHVSPQYLRLRELGVPVSSLTDLWLSEHHRRVIAVTGTKGKSTTSALIHHLLQALGVTSSLVGNGGTPVTAGDDEGTQVAVAEVSSYQGADLTASPRVAVVTSLYPEHLPWHGSFEKYVDDKLNLVAHGAGTVVVPDVDGDLAQLVADRIAPTTRLIAPASAGLSAGGSGVSWDGVGELPRDEVPLRGLHNVANLTLALTAVDAFLELGRSDRSRLLSAVHSFRPLAHRLETVPSADGRTWVDDSLATAPEAVVAALQTYPSDRVTLVFGGADRGLSYAPLLGYLAERPAEASVSVIAVGPAGTRVLHQGRGSLPGARLAPDFATALAWASADPDDSDIVLLSPGAPSFDEFASFEERSAAFRAAARTA